MHSIIIALVSSGPTFKEAYLSTSPLLLGSGIVVSLRCVILCEAPPPRNVRSRSPTAGQENGRLDRVNKLSELPLALKSTISHALVIASEKWNFPVHGWPKVCPRLNSNLLSWGSGTFVGGVRRSRGVTCGVNSVCGHGTNGVVFDFCAVT